MHKPYHLETAFAMKEVVYLRMAAEPDAGMIIGFKVWCDESITYVVGWGNRSPTEHFEPELTNEFEPKWQPGGGVDTDEG